MTEKRALRVFRAAGPFALLVCLALAAALCLTACAGSDSSASTANTTGSADTAATSPSTEPSSKTLVIGYEDYPPSCYLDEDGDPVGIDMDIATEALRRMGYTPVFKEIDWLDKDKLLSSGEIDCIWCSFSMDGREDAYTWAGPYMYSDEVVIVPTASPIETLDDLTGKIVGVAATSEPERLLLDRPDASIPDVATVCSLEDTGLLYSSLLKGYVDAIATHRLAAEQYIADYGVDARILDEPLIHVAVGVAFARDTDSPVPARLNKMLMRMKKDGTIAKIAERYIQDARDYLEESHA